MEKKYLRIATIVIMAVLIVLIALNAVDEINREAYFHGLYGERTSPREQEVVRAVLQVTLSKAILLGISVLIIGGVILYILREEKKGDKEK